MKRIYQIITAVAWAQFLALIGFMATLAVSGAFTRDRLASAVAALRGEFPDTPSSASQPTSRSTQFSPTPERIAREEEATRVRRTEMDRRERELEDQWTMLRESQLELLRSQEAFGQKRSTWRDALERQAAERDLLGAKKELEYVSTVKASLAKDILRQKKDADVVQLLLQMETRTGRKIIESCKTTEERLWIGRILEQLRQRNESQAEDLTAGQTS